MWSFKVAEIIASALVVSCTDAQLDKVEAESLTIGSRWLSYSQTEIGVFERKSDN